MAEANDSTPDDAVDPRRREIRTAVVVGVVLRVALALASVGSNDTRNWQSFGRDAWRHGFAALWTASDAMNHPPLPVFWAAAIYRLAGESAYAFGLLLKLPSIVADGFSIALVARIVSARTSPRAGAIAGLLMAINPTSILITGYHGNTDSILAFFTLLAWWLATRGRTIAAGLALAASLNVKVGPAPSVIVLLACANDRREFGRMIEGLAVGALPFVAMRFWVGPAFLANLIGYRPPAFSWLANVGWFSRSLPGVGPIGLFFASAHRATVAQATLLIAAVVAGLRLRSPARYDALTIGAIYWAAFMFWNGGGFQYCVWPVALFASVRPRLALAYGCGAAVYLAWAYLAVRAPGWPLESVFSLFDDERWHRALALPLLALLALLISLARAPTSAAEAGP